MSQKNQLSNYLLAALKKIATEEGFKDYEFVQHEKHSFGDGFVAIVFKLSIEEIENSRSVTSPKLKLQTQSSLNNRKLNFVIKVLPEDKKVNEQTGALQKFKREVFIYSEVLPKLQRLQEQHKIKSDEGFFHFPKCYAAEFNPETEESFLVLEDLTDKGYKMLDKAESVDFEHTCLLMKALGKFHALSFALKEQDPRFFNELKNTKDLMVETVTESYFKKFNALNFHRALGVLDQRDHKKHEIIMDLCKNYQKVMLELVDYSSAEPFAVLTHADCWTNNFMFQYEEATPQNIMLLDYQQSRYSSPVLDLLFFLFSCTDHEMRQQHYEELMKIYHNSLNEFLEKLGATTKFPYEKFQEQLKKFGKYGFICATFLIPILFMKNEEIPDAALLVKILEKPDNYKDVINEYAKLSPTFIEKMRGCIIDSFDYGYL